MVTTVTDNSPQSINTSLFSLDKEVQEVKKTADALNDKLSGINTESGVISVNGKQGIVELTASDVKALPSSTVIPTTTSELENTSGFITSSDSITGNAATATRAEQDADGNVITDTYATKAELGNKVDKVSGKGLSTNDFTTAEKEKLAGLSNYDDSAVKTLIANETSERKTADSNLQTQITANKSAIDTLNGTGEGSVQKTVTDEIAKVVANAPEDFDTLKEISDWIDTHEDSASAMNTQIQANKNEIASLKTEVAGKSDIGHTHSAADITSGTLAVERGGTGQTTQADINKAIVGELPEGDGVVTDGTMFVSSWASDNGFADTNATNVPYKRKFSRVWEYIKGKISSVLGLTANNYGGTAATILDYNRNTPIKVRWGGPGIDSAEWYPAFSADGSAIEPINRANIHAGTANYARNMYYQNLDLSSLDKTKFYPLVCLPNQDFTEVGIRSEGGMASEEYNQNRIHFDISTQGWFALPPTLNIREYTCYENNEITIGCIGRGLRNGAWAIWLRGGLHYTCFSRNADLSLHTSDYTFGDETYTVGTNYYGGSNTNVGAWFTPQYTITEGAYSNRPINAPNITSLEQRVAALESRL